MTDIEIIPTRTLSRQRLTSAKALAEVIDRARTYTQAREACPVGNWQERLENAGWELAQAVRAYDKTEI